MAEHKYLLLIPGILLEGDATILTAAFLCHSGLFKLGSIFGLAALVSTIFNHCVFLLGRRWAQPYFERRAAVRPGLQHLREGFARRKYVLILLSRFIWGLRLATVCVASMSGTHPTVFSVLDVLGALLWAGVLSLVGYYFGEVFDEFIDTHKHDYQFWMAIVLFVLVAILVWRTARRVRRTDA